MQVLNYTPALSDLLMVARFLVAAAAIYQIRTWFYQDEKKRVMEFWYTTRKAVAYRHHSDSQMLDAYKRVERYFDAWQNTIGISTIFCLIGVFGSNEGLLLVSLALQAALLFTGVICDDIRSAGRWVYSLDKKNHAEIAAEYSRIKALSFGLVVTTR